MVVRCLEYRKHNGSMEIGLRRRACALIAIGSCVVGFAIGWISGDKSEYWGGFDMARWKNDSNSRWYMIPGLLMIGGIDPGTSEDRVDFLLGKSDIKADNERAYYMKKPFEIGETPTLVIRFGDDGTVVSYGMHEF